MFADRGEIRRVYAAAWAKARAGRDLDANEQRIAEVIRDHPEYQRIVASGEAAVEADFTPEGGQTNPFLHMGLHIAIREQVAIDRPPGVRGVFERLAAKGDRLAAEHAMMECLARALWQAQRDHRQPDDAAYSGCLKRLTESADLR